MMTDPAPSDLARLRDLLNKQERVLKSAGGEIYDLTKEVARLKEDSERGATDAARAEENK